MVDISQFDVAPLHLILSPLLACDPGLPEILINVSCFLALTCRTPVLTLTISLGTIPRISSSWAETYFPMFNNSTSPQTHTVPQTSYTSEECPRPLMRPGFPNAKTPFNRFLLPQSPSSDKNLVTNYFNFALVHINPDVDEIPQDFCPNFQQFLAPSPDYRGLRRFLPIIPNSLRTPAAKVCHALFLSTQHNPALLTARERELLSIFL